MRPRGFMGLLFSSTRVASSAAAAWVGVKLHAARLRMRGRGWARAFERELRRSGVPREAAKEMARAYYEALSEALETPSLLNMMGFLRRPGS